MVVKTPEDEQGIREAAALVSATLAEIARHIRPGISAADLDRIAETFIRDHGADPVFKGYQGFPASICVSVEHEVVHGIPTKDKVLKEGMLVSVDVGVRLNGYVGDSAYTFLLPPVSEEKKRLAWVTYHALYKGIEQAVAGNRVGDIGWAIEQFVEREHGLWVVRDLVGHGVGRAIHEPPQVPNWGQRGKGKRLQEGLVIAIEPMVNLGTRQVAVRPDRWTIVTRDGRPSAHYEHMVLVRKNQPEVLSSFAELEKVFPPPFEVTI